MKILWIHQYFATPKGWGAVRTYEFARRFVKAGHAVDVVCCAGYDASLKSEGCRGPVEMDGMRVFVSGTAYRPHMGFVRRVGSFLRFMIYALLFVARKGRAYDVVIASSGPLTMAVPALAGRWLHHLPFVFEVIDVWPDSAIAAGVLKNPVLKWLSFKLEAFAYKYASAIVTCSTGMTERVLGKLGVRSEELGVGECEDGGRRTEGRGQRTEGRGQRTEDGGRSAKVRECESSKVVTISNCCDLEQFVLDAEKRRRARERLGVRNNQTVVLYTGAMGLSNAVDDLVDAKRETAGDERIVWWFAGSGPEAEKLMGFSRKDAKTQRNEGVVGNRQSAIGNGERSSKVLKCESDEVKVGGDETDNRARPENFRTLELSNFRTSCGRFFGSLPKEEVIELYLAADVNVVTFMHAPLFYENSPNKFFDGIAAGVPAVFNRTTWLEPWLRTYDCGIACPGKVPGREMAEAIRNLANDPERRNQMGRNARRLAEEVFDREKLAEKYLEILRSVAR